MIRLTKQTDYGIVLMSQIAALGEGPVNSPELARDTRLPLPMVSKILKLLGRSGLLESQRGVKGGYRLGRPASEISVADIITALEGPIALTECVEESVEECSYEAFCQVRRNWQRINRAIQGALQGVTLEQMVQPRRPRSESRPGAAAEAPAERLIHLGPG